jgi:hypothetical protein
VRIRRQNLALERLQSVEIGESTLLVGLRIHLETSTDVREKAFVTGSFEVGRAF